MRPFVQVFRNPSQIFYENAKSIYENKIIDIHIENKMFRIGNKNKIII